VIDIETFEAELAVFDLTEKCERRLGARDPITVKGWNLYSRITDRNRRYPSQAALDGWLVQALQKVPASWDDKRFEWTPVR